MRAMRPRVLFVCALNQWRSPTVEALYRDDPRIEVRSAGIRTGARRRVTAAELEWADLVLVMEREHKRWIQDQFCDRPLPRLEVLDIPDEYGRMDVELQELLRAAIEPEIQRLTRRSAGE